MHTSQFHWNPSTTDLNHSKIYYMLTVVIFVERSFCWINIFDQKTCFLTVCIISFFFCIWLIMNLVISKLLVLQSMKENKFLSFSIFTKDDKCRCRFRVEIKFCCIKLPNSIYHTSNAPDQMIFSTVSKFTLYLPIKHFIYDQESKGNHYCCGWEMVVWCSIDASLLYPSSPIL